MAENTATIKREPLRDAAAPSVATRDHLRALLDRARANKSRPPTTETAPVKREPTAYPTIRGLLPTPGSTAASPYERVHAQTALDHHRYEAPPQLSLRHRSCALPSAAPTTSQAPTSSFSHGYQATETAQMQACAPETATPWHYQTHPPPLLAIPPHPSSSSGDRHHTAQAHSATISPSMSATTSSSSSSHSTRRSRPLSPSPRSKAAPTTKRPRGPDHDMHGTKTPPVVAPKRLAVSALDEYEDNELHSDFVHTVHMLIPAGSFGCLVGHRGEYIKEINAVSECTLSVRDESSFPAFEADRVLRIYGKPKGICLAQQLVISRIREFRAEKQDSSYIDLGEDLLVPTTETSVTRTISEAIETVSVEDDPEVVAQHGELRWLIHKSDVGKILGQHGHIQKAIARDTNTTIHIVPIHNMPPGSTERTVIITGEPADIKRAHAMIKANAGGRIEARDTNSGKSGQYYVLPQHVTGALIGPKGTRIRKIRDETGASIQIAAQQDLPLGYVNRVIHIQGSKQQMNKARAAITRSLQSFMKSAEAMAATQEDEIALQLVLPIRICSFLLDQRGRLIREISEKAGAHARFLPPFDDDNRVCVIYGDAPKVFRAERLVLQFIAGDAIANKWATAGGAPPRKRKRASERGDEDADSENLNDVQELDSDDEAIPPTMRGRSRKRQQSESSGRIVVHYSTPPRPSSSRGSNRSTSGRTSAHAKSNGRNKRRR